eukprot:TRINITY_DN66920_c3_g3_i1.p1 TRINITY_DN66920_c3_g3~~TRINITY_DN66920_c3_g3_i1.p1  ORF type:complete len:153 (-),score=6.61 TRINITY_DN66920_c3_g3_i1:208-666(-)
MKTEGCGFGKQACLIALACCHSVYTNPLWIIIGFTKLLQLETQGRFPPPMLTLTLGFISLLLTVRFNCQLFKYHAVQNGLLFGLPVFVVNVLGWFWGVWICGVPLSWCTTSAILGAVLGCVDTVQSLPESPLVSKQEQQEIKEELAQIGSNF